MYLDMIHEKIVELKGVAQFIDFQVIVQGVEVTQELIDR